MHVFTSALSESAHSFFALRKRQVTNRLRLLRECEFRSRVMSALIDEALEVLRNA